MTMTMTGKVFPYKKGFGASMPEVWHVPFPAPQLDVTVEESLKYLGFLFKADIDPARVAAIIIEPVQGEGGFHQAPPELMRALRKICDENGIVLIADEVQTGYGRTGKMFAMEHYDVKPDLICVAKSLAGGFPLSGVIGKADIMDAADPGGLGGTYAGNPLAVAAANAVLDVFEKDKLVDRANVIGEHIVSRLKKMQQRNDLLPMAGVRAVGAMIAFDIVKERGGEAPDAEMTKKVTQRAAEHGLILLSCGTSFNTIRILVPLTAQDEIINEGLDKLELALSA
jgi:4-aminobutyrate aminotransferase/(S)-3-amino-2-methylpropionate transaminase